MVEPLEETRSELIFATEPILSSLELSIPGAKRSSPVVELDEVEVCALNYCGLLTHTLMHKVNRSRKAYCRYAKAYHSSTPQ